MVEVSALLSLIAGNTGSLAALGAVVVALAVGAWRMLANAKKAGINQAKVDSYEQSIKDVERAAQAGARVGTASGNRLPDPYDRDHR